MSFVGIRDMYSPSPFDATSTLSIVFPELAFLSKLRSTDPVVGRSNYGLLGGEKRMDGMDSASSKLDKRSNAM